MQAFLRQVGIQNYTTKSQVKAPGVERVIRTIRMGLQRYFERHQTTRWLEFIQLFIRNYNRRKHSTTGHPPNEVLNNPMVIIRPPKPRNMPKRQAPLPPIGTYVRLNRLRGLFDKEASGTWSEEVFRVRAHKTSSPIRMIHVEDLAGEPVLGALYPQEFQSVIFDTKKRQVDRVLETRSRKHRGRRRTEFRVTFKGYPPSVTDWVASVPQNLR